MVVDACGCGIDVCGGRCLLWYISMGEMNVAVDVCGGRCL